MIRLSAHAGIVALTLAVSGCMGYIDSDPSSSSTRAPGNSASSGGAQAGGGTTGSVSQQCTSEADASPLVLRRLSKLEYELTMQEMFKLAQPPDVTQLPEDSDQEGFRTIAALENVSDQHLRAYVDIATDQAAALMLDATRRPLVLGCEPEAAGCLESFIASFGKLAYRRPLDATETSDLLTRAQAATSDVTDRYRFVIESLLGSPSFLFRVEIGDGAALAKLDAFELASRLSFTLWGRGPSAALLDRAAQGDLDNDDGLSAVATEMLADPRAQTFYKAFFKQWLNFEELRVPNTRPPGFTDDLLPHMITETELVLDEFAWSPNLALVDALTANFTYVNQPLATFYGLSVTGTDFVKTEFPAGHQRAGSGLLTHPSLISSKSDGDLIAVRGKWLRGAFLCEKIEVPAGLLESLQSELSGLSYLEVLSKRNTEEACAGCHARIDPLGVGFAQYDAIGYYDGSVDPAEYGITPRFDGATNPDYANLAELATTLKGMPEVPGCIAEKVFTYTNGRFPDAQDECALEAIGQRFDEGGLRFSGLVQALVESPAFRLRRAPL